MSEQNPDALATSLGWLAMLTTLSQGLGQESRVKLAAATHTAADCLEGCTRPTGDEQQAVH